MPPICPRTVSASPSMRPPSSLDAPQVLSFWPSLSLGHPLQPRAALFLPTLALWSAFPFSTLLLSIASRRARFCLALLQSYSPGHHPPFSFLGATGPPHLLWFFPPCLPGMCASSRPAAALPAFLISRGPSAPRPDGIAALTLTDCLGLSPRLSLPAPVFLLVHSARLPRHFTVSLFFLFLHHWFHWHFGHPAFLAPCLCACTGCQGWHFWRTWGWPSSLLPSWLLASTGLLARFVFHMASVSSVAPPPLAPVNTSSLPLYRAPTIPAQPGRRFR